MRINYIRTLLLSCALLLSAEAITAQTARLYTTVEGLPSSHISGLFFDAENFLWVTTDLGLSRFNGERFTNFQAEHNNPYRLQENQINTIHIDGEGHYWVAGSDGLYYMDQSHNSFTRYSLSNHRQDISVSGIVDHPLKKHALIVTTYGWGMRVFDTQTCKVDSVSTTELQSLVSHTPPHIHVDRKGRLWGFETNEIDIIDLYDMRAQKLSDTCPYLAGDGYQVNLVAEDQHNGILYLATARKGILRVDLNTLNVQPLELPIENVTALAMGPNDELFIGTETMGLWIYNHISNQIRQLQSANLLRFGNTKIHSIAMDKQNNLWLGLYQKGVLVLPHRENCIFVRQPISFVPDGPNLGSVTGFASLADGGRAYALDGAGVVVDYADGQHAYYSKANSAMETDAVLSLASLPDGSVMVGTYQKGVYLIGKDRKVRRDPRLAALDNASITDFETDTLSNIIYIATNGDGLFEFDYVHNTLRNPVPEIYGIKWINNLFLCSHRRLWVSRADHLSCIDLETGNIFSPKQPSSRVLINGFAETSDGQLWLASNYGLLRYAAAMDSLVLIEEGEQKQRRPFSSLMNSQDGRLWMASSSCVTMYDTVQNRFVDFVDPTIASVGTFNYHSSKHWPDDTFSFGGDNGVITYSPENVHSFRRLSQRLIFSNLWVDNVPTDYDPVLGEENVLNKSLWCADSLSLPSSRASFSVSFTLLDTNGETGISYSYRLKGYDEEWHQCHGGSKMANYHSLPAGEYMLEVRAKDENDSRDDSFIFSQLCVRILPPWYATWWAILIWLAIVLVGVGLIVRQLLEHRHARHELREAETQRQLKESKLNLLTSVSHEIKTPLTLIISPLRKMMSRKTDPATHSVLEMMYRNSLRILMLVNQQMDVRKLDRGELRLHVRELPLRSFLDDLMQYFSSVALSRHITYDLTLPEGQDEMTLWADPAQLDKVVMNLLSNAVKFVPDGGRVNVEVRRNEKGATCITVYNSGSQLPEGQQEAAFSGIGLSIAREITELHHGTLTVRNLEDGVAFDIKLPAGNRQFTQAELAEVAKVEAPVEHVVAVETPAEVMPGERLEVVSSATVAEEDKERELAEQLNDELREKQRMRERRTSLDVTEEEPTKMSSSDEKLMRRVMDLIHKNMSDSEFSVETLSAELGISRVHLNRKLKELLDISPSVLIKSVRLKQAALLLIQSNVTVAEVAYSVGFSSPAYFTTNFTQYYGMTPKEFTNTYTENPDSPELKQLLGK